MDVSELSQVKHQRSQSGILTKKKPMIYITRFKNDIGNGYSPLERILSPSNLLNAILPTFLRADKKQIENLKKKSRFDYSLTASCSVHHSRSSSRLESFITSPTLKTDKSFYHSYNSFCNENDKEQTNRLLEAESSTTIKNESLVLSDRDSYS